jgi:hypothetical protein
MSAEIGPGVHVEFIGPDPSGWTGLVVKDLYVIDALVKLGAMCLCKSDVMVQLVGRPGVMEAYCPKLFRPIYRPDESLIEKLMEPVKEEAPRQIEVVR